jgi:hypothetical protein
MRKIAYSTAVVLFICLSTSSTYACCDVEQKEIMTNCNSEQLARGKSQADAEKSCKCEMDVVSKKLKDDLVILYVALMKKDDNAINALEAEKGSEWVASGMAELMKVALEIGNTCNAK